MLMFKLQNQKLSILNIKMGVCTSDPMGLLTNSYGDDVQKYFISVKTQQYLDIILPQVIQKVNQRFTNCSSHLNEQFDSKQQTIRQYFDKVLTKSLKESRTALEGIKKKEKKNEQEIFGLTSIHNKFIKLRMNKDEKLLEHKQNLLKILSKKKSDLKAQIISNRPSLPMLQEMSFWLKSQVEADMLITYERQLKMQQERLLNILQRSVYLQNLEGSIRKESGMEEADELGIKAQATFERIKRKLVFYYNPNSCFN